MVMLSKFRLVALVAVLMLTMGLVSACKDTTVQPTPAPTVFTTVQPTVTPMVTLTTTTDGQDVVEVIYFHRAQRCSGCIHAQEMTEYTLNTYFADELESGEVVFMAINLQDSANVAMVQKYEAYTSSLFLNDIEGGVEHIEGLTDIWFVLWEDEEFVDIVRIAIEERLAD